MANNGLGRLSDFLLFQAVGHSTATIRSEAQARLIQVAVMATAILTGIAALVLGLVALYIDLRQSIPPLEAAALMSGGLMLLTLFLWLAASLLPRRSTKILPDLDEEPQTADTPAAIASEVIRMIAEHPVQAGLTALAGGIAVGYSPDGCAKLLKALVGEKNREPLEL